MMQIAEMVAWAALAALCSRASWHRAEAIIGVSLVLCSLITSAAYFGSSLASRLVLEICQALCVTCTARIAFIATRSPVSAIIATLAAADAALVGALSFAWSGGSMPDKAVSYYLGWGANFIFAVQCLFVAGPGVFDVVNRWLSDRDTGRRMDHASGAAHVGRNSSRSQ